MILHLINFLIKKENINNPKHIKKSFDVLEKMEENYGIRSKKKEKKQVNFFIFINNFNE